MSRGDVCGGRGGGASLSSVHPILRCASLFLANHIYHQTEGRALQWMMDALEKGIDTMIRFV
jgi:hypothetical protein